MLMEPTETILVDLVHEVECRCSAAAKSSDVDENKSATFVPMILTIGNSGVA